MPTPEEIEAQEKKREKRKNDLAEHNVPSIISKELADAIDVPLNATLKIACDVPGQRNCIDAQIEPVNGKRKGWHDIDPKKMCASCACCWHLSCARNFALGVVR